MHKTIVPWRTSPEELKSLLANKTPLVSEKCLEWKNSNMETKFALFDPIRKDPNRKITYEEFLGIGEVFGDIKAISSPLNNNVSKEDAFNLIKQLIYFAVMGRKVPMDYDDQQIILQFARIRLSFFEGA